MTLKDVTIGDVFRNGGVLSEHLDGYEERVSQRELAMHIDDAFVRGEHLIAEAPTGTGKSLAYLIPAIKNILHQGDSKVVIATVNIALQEQLVEKDLPFIRDICGDDNFSFVLVKGKSNYLCVRSLEEFKIAKLQITLDNTSGEIDEIDEKKVFQASSKTEKEILKWAKDTESGDKSELRVIPGDDLWKEFSVTADDCLGKSCPYRDQCFAQKAKNDLFNTDVIVSNYSFLYSAINARISAGGKDVVLPPFDYLILDEAHRAPDLARNFFGWQISEGGMNQMVMEMNRLLAKSQIAGQLKTEYTKLSKDVSDSISKTWKHINRIYGKNESNTFVTKNKGIFDLSELSDFVKKMGDAFGEIANAGFTGSQPKVKKAKSRKLRDRALSMGEHLAEFDDFGDENGVYFFERYGYRRNIRLVKRSLDVSDYLWENMFSKTKSTIVTSATMAISGSCKYMRDEIGMMEGKEVIVDSPFDFRRQGMIVLSKRAPDPKAKDYLDRVVLVMRNVIEQVGGKTLGLFSSYRALNYVAERLKDVLEYTVHIQGSAPRMELVRRFKEDISSVLLGTESFWSGIDVPGEACSCVIIDKIPFPSPGDPVLDAMNDKCNGNGFWEVSVPRAVLQFRQGVGRLIRRIDDKGIVVVLDNRLMTKGYGSLFVKSLPDFRIINTLRGGEIGRFLTGRG